MGFLTSTFFKTGLEWLKTGLDEFFGWVKSVPLWFWGILCTFVFGPIGLVLDFILANLNAIEGYLESASDTLDELHFDEWGGYWSDVSEAAGICNVYIPLDLAFAVFAALIALWSVCMIIRLILKVKAIIWAG